MKQKFIRPFTLLILLISAISTPAHAQGGIVVSISAPSFAAPNTPVTLTAEVTESGAPKSGVDVTFFVDGAPIGSCTTDSLGKCQVGHIFGDTGEYTVSASAEGSSDSTTIVVGGTNTPVPPPPTRTPTPVPPSSTPVPPTSTPIRTNTPASSGAEQGPTPTRTPFFFNPSRTPTRTPTPLKIPSSTPTTDLFVSTPRIFTPTAIPTRTPRPTASGPIFAFPTISLGGEQPAQTEQKPLIDLSTALTVILSLALFVILILIIANFRRFRRLLWRLFRF
ncbi:MAG: hypothetical protein WHV44_05400 [Anaerolineales bacterium]